MAVKVTFVSLPAPYKQRDSMSNSLPTFDRPPVVETVLGFQFEPIPKLTTGHLGLFWKSLAEEWVSVAETAPIGQTTGFVSAGPSWLASGVPMIGIGAVRLPSMRLRMSNGAGDRMLQVENGWLVYNWRQRPGAQPYPRFDTIKTEFDRYRDAFEQFSNSNGFGVPKPNLWEVSYVNLVPKGELWNGPDDWPTLLPGLLGHARPSAASGLLSGDARWVFAIGGGKGQLLVQFEHGAMGVAAEQEIVVLRLIARGDVHDGSHDELESGFKLGHESIVTTFRDIAGPRALDYWGLKK
jgi:uncharacterized protein (TIGR04255 family)